MDFLAPQIEQLIRLALEEDAPNGDITSELLKDKEKSATGTIIVKQPGIICGLPLLGRIIDIYLQKNSSASEMVVTYLVNEGHFCVERTSVATITGSIKNILTLERIFLNFLQRLSGIATLTRSYVLEAKGNSILDTRKTTPGHRLLEKYAVTVGGGKNHRMNLSDMILIKNNHIDSVGGDFSMLSEMLRSVPHPYIPVEVEVRNHEELEKTILHLKPQRIMLDNFNDDQIVSAVTYIRATAPHIDIELSGGMNRERIKTLSTLVQGVYISVGALTTQAQNIDISMSI
jgi:nicotinate-nucleotide pyrophosphorylase (carboxylating)